MALTTRNTRETAPKVKSALALCECIYSSRLALGLTQAQVAGFSALSERFLGELENGRTSVSLSRVRTLATLLNIQILVAGSPIDQVHTLVRSTRKSLGLTQNDAAGFLGLSLSTLKAIEKGHQGVSLEKLFVATSGLGLVWQATCPAQVKTGEH